MPSPPSQGAQDRLRRFEVMYASRVRIVTLPSKDDTDLSPILAMFPFMKAAYPLFPNLHTLNWDFFPAKRITADEAHRDCFHPQIDNDEGYAKLFMHDRVSSFRMREISEWDNSRRVAFLGQISKYMPHLETLEITLSDNLEFMHALVGVIRNLSLLKKLVISPFPDPVSVFSELQGAPNKLEDIRFCTSKSLTRSPLAPIPMTISSPYFENLKVLHLACAFELASPILKNLFTHDQSVLTDLVVVSSFRDTASDFRKLCGIIAQVGRRLSHLRLSCLRFIVLEGYNWDWDVDKLARSDILHIRDIEPILSKCSELTYVYLDHPLYLSHKELQSMAVAWPKVESGEIHLVMSLNDARPFIKVRSWSHTVQKKCLMAGDKVNDSREEMLLVQEVFRKLAFFPMTVPILMYSKIDKVIRHIALLEPERIPFEDEFKFCFKALVLWKKWASENLLLEGRLRVNLRISSVTQNENSE